MPEISCEINAPLSKGRCAGGVMKPKMRSCRDNIVTFTCVQLGKIMNSSPPPAIG